MKGAVFFFFRGMKKDGFAVDAAPWMRMSPHEHIANALDKHHIRRSTDAKGCACCHNDKIAIAHNPFFQSKTAA